MTKLNFGGIEENVITREEFSLDKAREILRDEVIAVIGYGVQGPAQALNLRDNGFNVIVGQRKGGFSWQRAVEDNWREGKDLFEIDEAVKRGTVIAYLLSDAGQIEVWPRIKHYLTSGKALYFSHGFGVVYKEHTGIIPPADIDVILVAPKGAGRSVREHFLKGKGINASYAVFQDYTGRALERTLAMGIGIGAGYLFETTFEKEVYSDLTGERGILLGALAGVMEAQYNLLRKYGHSPSEAFNETVEELTESLIPLMAQKGVDWMIANCSTTAQRGALDWKDKFKKAVEPVFEQLYQRVKSGEEAKRVIQENSKPDYREKLNKELSEIHNSEMWQAGAVVRQLRPENQEVRAITKNEKKQIVKVRSRKSKS
ncbi:MAG: ketol-acid reductoisomerase [Patescibacteria group bacterium]|nr:MAG: ketol-acid reductoisomerase [Patescibacteria group bacterium]